METKPSKTVGLISTLAAIFLCACPGFFLALFGGLTAFGVYFGLEDYMLVVNNGLLPGWIGYVALCVAIFLLCLPIVVGFFMLRDKRPKTQKTGKTQSKRTYYEKDNRGTRHNTAIETNSYWPTRSASQKYDPFVLYTFASEKEAKEALLEIPCIHMAEDSGKPICTETLLFGYYAAGGEEKEAYDSFICGSELTYELWEKAKKSFIAHGGKPRGQGDQAPEKRVIPAAKKKKSSINKVKYVRTDRETKNMGAVSAHFTYEIYRGPDATTAKEFLSRKSVTKQNYYIIVETPEGNYGRDIGGIYKE